MTVDVKDLYEEISSDEGKILHAYLCTELHATVGKRFLMISALQKTVVTFYFKKTFR